MTVKAHIQRITNRYRQHWPKHEPREGDPHKHLFDAYRRAHVHDAACYVGQRIGFQHCAPPPLELHHAHLEESAKNGADLKAVRVDWPAVHDVEGIARFVESDQNFRFLCSWHHRSAAAGAHHASHSDWEVGCYVPTFLDQYDTKG